MPERSSRPKCPRNLNQLAASIVDAATGDEPDRAESDESAESGKNPHAAALGRLGGKKGGPARALKLSAERRSEIARMAAEARWQLDRRGEQGG